MYSGLIAFVLFVIAAIMAYLGKDHSSAVAYAGLAFLAIAISWPVFGGIRGSRP